MLKEGFEGVIKKGTSLYQMIPFKRDSLDAPTYEYNYDMLLDQNAKINNYKLENKTGAYKKLFWERKDIYNKKDSI